jgi:cyclopropane fatty-acyl-phospholipid synthase-like methyltransferase
VTDPSDLGSGSHLTFHGPLSAERADRLATELATRGLSACLSTAADGAHRGPATVVDYGCGWGELLLRVLSSAPEAHGVGIDVHAPDIARATENASKRGFADRVAFIEGSATEHTTMADVVISCGAYQAFGTVPEALGALRALVNPGGRLLFGAEFWDRTPTERELANMWPGMTLDECLHLPDLVDAAINAGFRPLRIETATRGEWEEFESGYAAGTEEWLLSNADHAEAAQVRARLDEHRSMWLRGYRDVLGFAYLTLGVAA